IRPKLLLLLIIPSLSGSTEIRDGSCCFFAAVPQDTLGVPGIEDAIRGQSGPAPDRAAVADIVVLGGVVGVVVDSQQGAGLPTQASPAVVEIEAKRAAVDFQGGPSLGRFRDHRLHVEAGFSTPVETSRSWMGVDVHVRRS